MRRLWSWLYHHQLPPHTHTRTGNHPSPPKQACRGNSDGGSGWWSVALLQVWLHSETLPRGHLHSHTRPRRGSICTESPRWASVLFVTGYTLLAGTWYIHLIQLPKCALYNTGCMALVLVCVNQSYMYLHVHISFKDHAHTWLYKVTRLLVVQVDFQELYEYFSEK